MNLGRNRQRSRARYPGSSAAPSFTFSTVRYDGDSRTASAGNFVASGVSATAGSGIFAAGMSGLIQSIAGNIYLLKQGHVSAVGGSTTLAADTTYRAGTASNLNSGNGAFAITAAAGDASFNVNSDGNTTIDADTATAIVSAAMGVNDVAAYFDSPNLASQTLILIAKYFDERIAAGKRIIVGNGFTRGRSFYTMESRTVTAGTCTAINTGNFVDGEQFGAVGVVGVFAAGNPRPLTKVSSAPLQDEYTVTALGVYVFGGTAPTTAYLNYNANGTSGNITDDRIRVIREWMNSSDANFTSTVNGVNYGLPGAKFGRPTLTVVDTWNTLRDPTSGALDLCLPGTQDNLQLHGVGRAHVLTALKFKTDAFDVLSPGAPSLDQRPTRNNWYAARGTGGAGVVYSGTLPPSMRAAVPTLISVQGVPIGRVNTATGAITGTGITSGAGSFYTVATGAWQITFNNSATSMPVNNQLWFEQDIGDFNVDTLTNGTIGRNMVNNGLMELFTAVGTNLPTIIGASSITGIAAASIPYGWTFSSTALNNAVVAGTARVAVSSGTDANGFPEFNLDTDGAHTANIAANFLSTASWASAADRMPTTFDFATGARISYAKHPTINRMYGTTGAVLAGTIVSTVAVTRNSVTGPIATVTSLLSRINDTGSGLYLDDTLLGDTGGKLDYYRISPLMDLSGATLIGGITGGGGTLTTGSTFAANVPFAMRLQLGRVQVRGFSL